jgi:hypothetical protein
MSLRGDLVTGTLDMLASLVPARRALHIEPAVALETGQ